MESSTKYLQNIHTKVSEESTKKTNLSHELLSQREAQLRAREQKLEAQEQHNIEVILTFKNLKSELEQEKLKLQAERDRIVQLQRDFTNENSLKSEQIAHEKNEIWREKKVFLNSVEKWEKEKQKEMFELEKERENVSQMTQMAHQQLEEAGQDKLRLHKILQKVCQSVSPPVIITELMDH
jgi:hypothetical protein